MFNFGTFGNQWMLMNPLKRNLLLIFDLKCGT